jgi:hypothetical protein
MCSSVSHLKQDGLNKPANLAMTMRGGLYRSAIDLTKDPTKFRRERIVVARSSREFYVHSAISTRASK